MKSSLNIRGIKGLQTFGALKQITALSCLLAVAGAPLTLWAGKAPPPPPPSSYAYSLIQLSLPVGASSFGANGLNNLGQVVGAADFPNNEYVGCLWQPNNQTVQLPLLPGAQLRRASAESITDSGLLIAGYSMLYSSTNGYMDGQHATFWENTAAGFQPRDWNDLMPLELGIHLIRSMASSDGQYVVFAGSDSQTGDPSVTVIAQIVYDANGSITGINVLDVLSNAGPQAINADGAGVVRVLGICGSYQPFLWKKTEGGISLLVAPLASFAGDIESQKIGAVNKFGQVANTYGTFSNTNPSSKALRWEETQLWDLTQATGLGSLGGSLVDARDINDAGQVVGTATLAGKTAPQRAYVFQNGSMTDLNKLAPVGTQILQVANRINNSGQILALGTAWVLLTPVNP